MAEPCGDQDLVRAAHGLTASEPCRGFLGQEWYCNIPDVNAWKVRVGELKEMMVATWNALWDAEEKLPERDHTREGSDLRLWWERIDRNIEAVPEVPWYGIGDQAERAVTQYQGIAQDQACIIETMRGYIKAIGEKPPPLPYFEPSPVFDIGEVLAKQAEEARKQTPKVVTGLLLIGGGVALAYALRPVLMKALERRPPAPKPTAARAKPKEKR